MMNNKERALALGIEFGPMRELRKPRRATLSQGEVFSQAERVGHIERLGLFGHWDTDADLREYTGYGADLGTQHLDEARLELVLRILERTEQEGTSR